MANYGHFISDRNFFSVTIRRNFFTVCFFNDLRLNFVNFKALAVLRLTPLKPSSLFICVELLKIIATNYKITQFIFTGPRFALTEKMQLQI